MNLSKRSFSVLGISLALTLAMGAGLLRAQDQDFTLINRTGYDIHEVYLSAANANSWGEDVFGKDIFANGDKVPIEFDKKATACIWDMKIVFSDGEEAIWEDFNLCKIEEITLKYEGKRPTATWK